MSLDSRKIKLGSRSGSYCNAFHSCQNENSRNLAEMVGRFDMFCTVVFPLTRKPYSSSKLLQNTITISSPLANLNALQCRCIGRGTLWADSSLDRCYTTECCCLPNPLRREWEARRVTAECRHEWFIVVRDYHVLVSVDCGSFSKRY